MSDQPPKETIRAGRRRKTESPPLPGSTSSVLSLPIWMATPSRPSRIWKYAREVAWLIRTVIELKNGGYWPAISLGGVKAES